MRLLALALALTLCATSAFAKEKIREEISVEVDGAQEIWRVVSSGKTTKICVRGDPDSAICPCSGFQDADNGKFSVVRLKNNREIDRLELGQFFGRNFPLGRAGANAWLTAPVLQLADYDHNGKALEFLLQVDTAPCGKPVVIAIGISFVQPHLHALSSVELPSEPMSMSWEAWRQLLNASGPVSLETWACGDHGAETSTTSTFSAEQGVLHFTSEESDCP